jgi:hypothetical protein
MPDSSARFVRRGRSSPNEQISDTVGKHARRSSKEKARLGGLSL